MKENKETELRLEVNHNYFIRNVIIEGCKQLIVLIVAIAIIAFCMAMTKNNESTALSVIIVIASVAYLIYLSKGLTKIYKLHQQITEYEDSVVKDTIHSAIK